MKESTENSLYHFKTRKEYFLQIISEFKFTPRYNREFILLNPKSERPAIELVIPMVCWCDIPLGRIKNHTSRYGNYGIGITKEWAVANFINPIFYVIENTVLARLMNNMSKALSDLGEIMDKNKELKLDLYPVTSNLYPAFNYLSQHIKPYSYQNIPSRQENRKYYDEKEWRYVPDPIGHENLVLYPYLYDNEEALRTAIEAANEKIKKRYLYFEPKHVQIIIIEEESDRIDVLYALQDICQRKGFSDYKILSKKVKTIDEIENLNIHE